MSIEFEPGVGIARQTDGVWSTDALGLAVRVGLSKPSQEAAAELFPGFELFPWEERPEPGEVFADRPVFCWLRQSNVATTTGLSTRQILNLERKGFPSVGSRKSKRYPVPHLHVWLKAYRLRGGSEGRVSFLPFEVAEAVVAVALAEADLRSIEAELG